jgi:hypothetical protein
VQQPCPVWTRSGGARHLVGYHQQQVVNWIFEEEYKKAILKNGSYSFCLALTKASINLCQDWTQFVLKGHNGFHLTEEKVKDEFKYKDITCSSRYVNSHLNWIIPEALSPPQLQPSLHSLGACSSIISISHHGPTKDYIHGENFTVHHLQVCE